MTSQEWGVEETHQRDTSKQVASNETVAGNTSDGRNDSNKDVGTAITYLFVRCPSLREVLKGSSVIIGVERERR